MNHNLSIIGAPTDIGAAVTGMNLGPDALRSTGLLDELQKYNYNVSDLGNLKGPLNKFRNQIDGYKNLEEVILWNRKIYDSVYNQLENNNLPILLGGDHSLSIGSIHAVSRYCKQNNKNLIVLWLDAHLDMNTNLTSITSNIHGMPTACLLGYGHNNLIGKINEPSILPQDIKFIGTRSTDVEELEFAKSIGVEMYDMKYVRTYGIGQAIQSSLKFISKNTHIHISFDVDMLDPYIAPGTGCRCPDGILSHEINSCMELLFNTNLVGSIDIMELNPLMDNNNKTGKLIVEIVKTLFSGA